MRNEESEPGRAILASWGAGILAGIEAGQAGDAERIGELEQSARGAARAAAKPRIKGTLRIRA